MSTDTNSVQACLGVNCLVALPKNPFESGWRDGYCPECLDELARDEIRAERQDARNEMDRPTPITDAMRLRWHESYLEAATVDEILDSHAALERQLAEAREEKIVSEVARSAFVDAIANALNKAGAETHHPDIGAPARKPMMPQERIAFLAEQRDRLAEALETAYLLIRRHHDVEVTQKWGCHCPACHRDGEAHEMDQIIAALATLDRKEEE